VKFESAMQTAAQDRIRLEVDLLGALDKDQFFLVYQPMLDLESERVVGAEALIRWNHPTGGLISPDAFVPIAEENGMIVAIGRWVLEQACAQAAAWHREGFHLNISVNVSARQLERPEFVEEVRTALKNSGLDPADLTLEITETVLMRKPDVTAQLLGELKGLGLRIAVDDFGTGYSSLAYLRQFPVDSLKIDRTFITGLALSRDAHADPARQGARAADPRGGRRAAQPGARAAARGVRHGAGLPVRATARPRRAGSVSARQRRPRRELRRRQAGVTARVHVIGAAARRRVAIATSCRDASGGRCRLR